MKNMAIRSKLIFGFSLMLAIIILISAIGIFGMTTMCTASDSMYENNVVAMAAMAHILDEFQLQRVALRDIALAKTPEKIQSALGQLSEAERIMKDNVAVLTETATKAPYQAPLFNDISTLYQQDYAAAKQNMRNAIAAGDMAAFEVHLAEGAVIGGKLEEKINELNDVILEDAQSDRDYNDVTGSTLTIVLVSALALAIVAALFLIFKISGLIVTPLKNMVAVAEKLSIGDVGVNMQVDQKDEIGQLASAFGRMVEGIKEQAKIITEIAEGDLSMTVSPRSDKDIMSIGLNHMLEANNEVFSEITHSAANVSSGAKQVADGSQSLAQATTEQAAVVEQLSSSIGDISGKTVKNASMAQEASVLGQKINSNAQKGSTQMNHMMQAVREINEASQSINKVIKVIDDIAFQTNILALNAAVEAARAGQHGKGFAVVAEEVRSLAAKSAEAAKDTGALIANSMEKAEFGAKIAQETSQSLSEIVEGIQHSSAIVADIARLSDEQAAAILQINKGIDQVSQVVQTNSATAEESAAASEEMSGQSSMLSDLISRFKLKDAALLGSRSAGALPRANRIPETPSGMERTSFAPAEGGYGKY